jgi:putative redox protein
MTKLIFRTTKLNVGISIFCRSLGLKIRDMADSRAQVRIGKENYKTEINLRQHTLIADEPEEVGGTDLGPTPSELLAASLGSCIAITMRMYADRKGWPLDAVQVSVEVLKEDSDNVGSNEQVTVFEVKTELSGALDEAQERRIRIIGTKCPIHKILQHTSEIRMV